MHHLSRVSEQICRITKRMLILMLKTHLNQTSNRTLSLSLCSPSALSIYIQRPKNLLLGMQYFYSGLALWIKYCHLWPLWFYPVFFPLSFTSRLYLPGGWFSCSLTLSLLGFFPLQGKMASTFSLLSFLSSCCWAILLSNTWFSAVFFTCALSTTWSLIF